MIDLTKITTRFGLLDAETQAALKAHKESGGQIELHFSSRWVDFSTQFFSGLYAYRVKPAALTPITAPWEHLADWVQWIARDENGEIWCYEDKPKVNGDVWVTDWDVCNLCAVKLDPGTCDWRDSLQQRPQVLA